MVKDCTVYMAAGFTMQKRVSGTWKSSVLSLQKRGDSQCFVTAEDKVTVSWEGHNITNTCDGILERLAFSHRNF